MMDVKVQVRCMLCKRFVLEEVEPVDGHLLARLHEAFEHDGTVTVIASSVDAQS